MLRNLIIVAPVLTPTTCNGTVVNVIIAFQCKSWLICDVGEFGFLMIINFAISRIDPDLVAEPAVAGAWCAAAD